MTPARRPAYGRPTQPLEIHLLSAVEATVQGRPVELGATKQRALLAMLALEPGRTVTVERLIDGLWADDIPATAPKMVQGYVSQLRKVLPGAIETRGRGYELRVPPEAVDAVRFEGLVDGHAREALRLWRGGPLADVADEPFAAPEIRRLEELWLAATELAVADDLAAGRHLELLPRLELLATEHPLRERLHALRMLALYRAGRQADALEAYHEARGALGELGLEPGAELRALQQQVLNQDPQLDLPPPRLPTALAVAAPPLAGREAALARLRAAWEVARAGRSGALVLLGPEGIGKTRLAVALAAEVHAAGGTVTTSPAEAEAVGRPALLVLDDLDRADASIRGDARRIAANASGRALLVLATARERIDLGAPELALEPLAASDVAAIAATYGAPAAEVVAAAGGFPGRAHAAAAEWAERDAERRVRESTLRAAAGRDELRSREARVAGDVADLQAARERSAEALSIAPGVCPFKGLAPFEPEDAPFYFGREQLVADMIARLVGARLLALIGPSGSGKSSALRAGLLPALANGTVPGSERWEQVLIRPGEHPLGELPRAAGRRVLAVDQFEELFTVCRSGAERRAFADALVDLAEGGTIVVLALRADFYGRCAGHRALARLMAANQVLVGPPQPDELRRAVEAPARRAGLQAEPELADALVADLEGEPGALPLLSTALLELWRRRDGPRLRLAAYERTGGVRGAVARLAEDAYADLQAERRDAARRILLRLAGEDERGVLVRRRVPLRELEGDADVLGALADRRLITVSAESAEVAHEALLREWPRLAGWLADDAEGRRLHRHLTRAAQDWDERGRDDGDLYRGARLASALDWSAGDPGAPNSLEREFLDASRDRSQRQAIAARRTNRRLRGLLAGAAALLAIAVVAGLVALDQRGNADRAATIAQAEHLGATALLDKQLDRSLLLARAATDIADSVETRGNLLASLLRSPAALAVVHGDGDRELAIAMSPDGRTVALGDNDGTVLFFDTSSHRRTGVYQAAGTVVEMSYAPDGRLVLSGVGQRPYVDVVDTLTHRRVASLTGMGDRVVAGLDVSPDGRLVAGAYGRTDAGETSPGEVRIWELAGGDTRGRAARVSDEPTHPRNSLAFTPDGRRLTLLTGDPFRPAAPQALVVDVATLKPVSSHRVPDARVAALSPDGHTLAVGTGDGSVEFLDLRDGTVRKATGRHETGVQAMRFSPDGKTLVTGSDDLRVMTWSVSDGAQRETWEGHSGRVLAAAFSPDGRTVWTDGLDGTAIAWDVSGARRIGTRFSVGPPGELPLDSGALSPDGRTLAVTRPGGTVALVDTGTLRVRARLHAPPRTLLYRTLFSPDGRLLAVSGADGYLALFDPATGREVGRLRMPRGQDTYTPGLGRRFIVAGGSTQIIRVYDRASLRPVGRPLDYNSRGGVGDIGISAGDRVFALALGDGHIDVRDVRTQRLVRRLRMGDSATWSRFSPDGSLLVGGDSTGAARVWSTGDWHEVVRPLTGQAGFLESAAVTRDDRLLATSNTDGTVALWDLSTGKPVGTPLPGIPNRPAFADFAPDGAHLFVTYVAGDAYRWDIRLATWRRRACDVAGRSLTRDEWARFAPDRPYDPVCG